MRESFDKQLSALSSELIEMGGRVEAAIVNAVKSLEMQDKDCILRAREYDREIDEMERSIERRCLKLLLRQQPVASDLRLISTALKIITDMERIGDQAEDISELTKRIAEYGSEVQLFNIPKMAECVIKMVGDAIDSFVRRDLELAQQVIAYDDVIDKLFNETKEELIGLIAKNSSYGEQFIDLLLIAKYFERIGDHAENIGEWVIFSITGEHKNDRIL